MRRSAERRRGGDYDDTLIIDGEMSTRALVQTILKALATPATESTGAGPDRSMPTTVGQPLVIAPNSRIAALEVIVHEAIENLEARARNYEDDGDPMLAQGARDFARHLRQRLAESTGDSTTLDR